MFQVLPKIVLQDAVKIIIEELGERLVEEESVTIQNFGTISRYKNSPIQIIDFQTKELITTKPSLQLKLIPDKVFLDILSLRKDFFKTE